MVRIMKIALLLSIPVALLKGYTVDYSLSQFSFYKENGFDRIKASGFTFIGESGTPELPSVYLHYIIPPDAKVESLIVLQSNISEINGQFLIYPTQPPVSLPETIPWVPPDSVVYNQNELYPEKFIEVVNEGVMDGARIVTIAVHPIQYCPITKQLFLISYVDFKFELGAAILPELRPQIRGRYEQSVYDATMKNLVENDYEIPVYYIKPTLVEDNQIGQLAPFPAGPAMIITDPTFANEFQPYVDWLTDQGIRANIISPSIIYFWFPGRDKAERIRNYIKYCYKNAGGTYFILGGDGGNPPKLPFRKCHCMNYWGNLNDTIPCDYYFGALDGDWNADGDDTWGEMNDIVDQFPEVFVGRILCGNAQEVSNWCYKSLTYEKSPGNLNSSDTVVWIWQSTWFMGDISIFPEHFTHIVAENYNAESAFNLFDHGYIFTNVQTHGHVLGFWPKAYEPCSIKSYMAPPPDWWGAGLNHLKNDDRYFINYCVGCKTGAFDWSDICVADAFTDAYCNSENGIPVGACASIEHTRASWGPGLSITLENRYYEMLFSHYVGPAPPEVASERIGVALAQAKSYMSWGNSYYRWVCYATNLYGSPTVPAWTKAPGNMRVTHPTSIPVGEQLQFTVTVKTASLPPVPLQYAKVCLNKRGDIYEVGSTDANGQITFYITPQSTGTMKVTVTRYHNTPDYSQYLPYQGDVQVFEFDVTIPNAHTMFTEGRKLVRQPRTENLYFTYTVFSSPGTNQVAYTYSTDGGANWAPETLLGLGKFPTIALDAQGYPNICWVELENGVGWERATLWYTRFNGTEWTAPVALYTVTGGPEHPIQGFSQPAMVISAADTVCLVWESSESWCAIGGAPAVSVWTAFYGQFHKIDTAFSEIAILDTVVSVTPPYPIESPGIACDIFRNIHCVWSKPGENEIYYCEKTLSGFSEKVNISESPELFSEHPFIFTTNEKVIVVWSEEGIAGNYESRDIERRERYLGYPWQELITVVQTPNQASDWPIITANDKFLVWCEHQLIDTTRNWEVLYASSLYGSDNLSNTPYTQSLYPSCDWRQTLAGLYLYTVYTEKYESEVESYLFGVKAKRRYFDLAVIPLYTIYGGGEFPSPYLVQRDGYIPYENYPVDYDTNELIYKFTGLNPDLKYRLEVTVYHESEGEWRERVKIDNTAQHLIKYEAGIPKTVELPVPLASYINDGEIIVRIPKISGDFASFHIGNLYEFEKEGCGGPQTVATVSVNLGFGLKVLPNIVTRDAKFQYTIPEKQRISLRLYDIIGRKVATIIEETVEPGKYNYNFNSSQLSQGIYFLILEGEKETNTKKVLVIK